MKNILTYERFNESMAHHAYHATRLSRKRKRFSQGFLRSEGSGDYRIAVEAEGEGFSDDVFEFDGSLSRIYVSPGAGEDRGIIDKIFNINDEFALEFTAGDDYIFFCFKRSRDGSFEQVFDRKFYYSAVIEDSIKAMDDEQVVRQADDIEAMFAIDPKMFIETLKGEKMMKLLEEVFPDLFEKLTVKSFTKNESH